MKSLETQQHTKEVPLQKVSNYLYFLKIVAESKLLLKMLSRLLIP